MSFKNYREESRNAWGTHEEVTLKNIKVGAILRIADATEKMANNYVRMENDLKVYKNKYEERTKDIEHLHRVIAALRGHLKRAKKKVTMTN